MLTSVPSSTTAGSTFTVTVTATNPNGTTDTGYTGTVQFTSTDPQAVLPANYTFTTADQGVHTFTATLKTAGSQSLTVTDTTNPAIAGTQTGITVSPAAASHLVIFTFGSTFAGSALPADVTAEDPYGNTAAGYTGTVHFTSSDPQAVLPANYTFTAANAGVADLSVTLKTAGTQSFTVTDTSTPSLTATASHITVLPLQATHFVISGPTSVAPGAAFNITVIALDPYGNDATFYFGTVSFTSSDSLATLPKNYTFKTTDKGEHTFSGLKLHNQGQANDHGHGHADQDHPRKHHDQRDLRVRHDPETRLGRGYGILLESSTNPPDLPRTPASVRRYILPSLPEVPRGQTMRSLHRVMVPTEG